MTTCSSCNKSLATADVLYTEDAQPVCVGCTAQREIKRDEKNAARNIKMAGVTCLVAGVVGFAAFYISYGLFFYPAAIVSVASGLYAGQAMLTSDRFTAHMTSTDKTVTLVCTIGGLAIAAFETLVLGGYIDWRPRI